MRQNVKTRLLFVASATSIVYLAVDGSIIVRIRGMAKQEVLRGISKDTGRELLDGSQKIEKQ